MENENLINDPVLQDLIERREDEPFNAYSAFCYFGTISEAERHAPDVNTKCAAHVSVSADKIKEWRRVHDWDARASLIDAYGYKLSFAHNLELLKQDNRLFVQHNREYKEKLLQLSDDGLSMLVEMIGNWRDYKPKIADVPAILNAMIKVRENLSKLPTDLIDTLSHKQSELDKMTAEELEEFEAEIKRQEKLLMIEGGEQ